MPKLIKLIILLLIIVLGIFFRFYRLIDFPVQLNHDEVSQLYDAISIAQTGRDIYGNFMPTMFVSVNDFKSPFYTYITSIFYFIFGGGELTIRLPAAMFGVLMIPAVYFFVLKLFKRENAALVAAFFTAIAPFEIFFSRKSFENGAGIFFMLIGFTCLLTYKVSKASAKLLFIAFLFLGIGMYTYFSHAIIIPLLLGIFVVIFKQNFIIATQKTPLSQSGDECVKRLQSSEDDRLNKEQFSAALVNLKGKPRTFSPRKFIENWKKALIPFTLFLVALLPLLLIVVTNSGARYRSQTVFVTQDINLGKIIDFSKKDHLVETFLTRNKAIADFSFNRYLEQFNIDYIFINGLDFTNQGPLGMGPLLLLQLPFLLLGIIYLIKLAGFRREKIFIFAWVLVGMVPSGLTFESTSPHRSIMVFTMLNIISALGFYSFLNKLKPIGKYIILKKVGIFTLVLLLSFNIVYFIHMYFVNFPFEKSQYIHYPFKQVAQFAWSQHGNYDRIVFDPLFGESAPVIGTAAHYYIAYYGNLPPSIFQKQYRSGNKEREVLFDKFSIRKIDWRQDQYFKNVLFIGSSWSLPIDSIDKNKIIKQFNFYDGKAAFYAIKL